MPEGEVVEMRSWQFLNYRVETSTAVLNEEGQTVVDQIGVPKDFEVYAATFEGGQWNVLLVRRMHTEQEKRMFDMFDSGPGEVVDPIEFLDAGFAEGNVEEDNIVETMAEDIEPGTDEPVEFEDIDE